LTSTSTSKPDNSATKALPLRAFDKLYWLRAGFGVLAGILADQIFVGDLSSGILVGVIVYLSSFYIAKYVWFKDLDREHITKLYSTGLLAYVGYFVLGWILVFTFSVQ